MNYEFYIGIDMSKKTFDYCFLDRQGTIIQEGQVRNNIVEIEDWINRISLEMSDKEFWKCSLLCMEHSGYYGTPLIQTLHRLVPLDIWLESALQIKRSIGLQRGKNDRVDAQRIASYSLDFQRKARLWRPTPASIERLELLLSHRDRMVKNLMSLRNPLKEEEGFIAACLHQEMEELNQEVIESMEEAITNFNERINDLLQEDMELKRLSVIIQSVPGFGQVISSKIIAITRGFTRLTDPRSFACFSGVAPFEHRSGTSLKGKTRVSHLANKDLKKMLHLAALVTIRKDNIMHDYYQRKVAEGKNKMLVINAIRNKLIHIVFACIKSNNTYQKNFNHYLEVT